MDRTIRIGRRELHFLAGAPSPGGATRIACRIALAARPQTLAPHAHPA